MATSVRTPSSTRDKLLRAQSAATRMAQLTTTEKNAILLAMADALAANTAGLITANQKDLDSAGLTGAMRDRLLLTPDRIAAMVSGVREVASLPDPVGETIAEWTRPNGLHIRKVRVPLGVVGIIYESRPNVTVDCAALVLKTGNAIVLRGGKEAAHSNQMLVGILNRVEGVPQGAIELLDSSTRDSVHELIRARGLVDVLIPRGGPGLISYVADNATVPVIETGAGNCHIFVDQSADFEMADGIVINAKTQRPSVCNSAEKLLVHQSIAAEYVPRIVKKLLAGGVEVRGDDETMPPGRRNACRRRRRAGLERRISAAVHRGPGCRRHRGRDCPYQPLFHQKLGRDCYPRRSAGPPVSAAGGFRSGVLERFDPLLRRRGIWLRRGNGDQHSEAALPRPFCPGGTDVGQV